MSRDPVGVLHDQVASARELYVALGTIMAGEDIAASAAFQRIQVESLITDRPLSHVIADVANTGCLWSW